MVWGHGTPYQCSEPCKIPIIHTNVHFCSHLHNSVFRGIRFIGFIALTVALVVVVILLSVQRILVRVNELVVDGGLLLPSRNLRREVLPEHLVQHSAGLDIGSARDLTCERATQARAEAQLRLLLVA